MDRFQHRQSILYRIETKTGFRKRIGFLNAPVTGSNQTAEVAQLLFLVGILNV